jgi:hypothetical protein
MCGATHYQTVFPSLDNDRECAHLTVCASGYYQTVAPTPTSDRNCSAVTVCKKPNVVKVLATPLTNTICAVNCSVLEFEATAPAVTYLQRSIDGPKRCKTIRECNPPAEFEEFPPTTSTDRVCRLTVTCALGDFEAVAPSATSDRICMSADIPILNVFGEDVIILEASHEGVYSDKGAVCHQQSCESSDVVCDISNKVDISGDSFPELHVPGTYDLKYTCIASHTGHSATPAIRRVIVVDTRAPMCTLHAGPSKVEASFPYTDPGFTCVDNIDGAIVLTAGNSAVIGEVDPEMTGTYLITYRAKDSSGNWNNCTSCTGRKILVRTVTVLDTLVPVIALHDGPTSLRAGEVSDQGVGGETNPVGTYAGLGYMANRRRLVLSSEGKREGGSRQYSGITTAMVGVCVCGLVAVIIGLQ